MKARALTRIQFGNPIEYVDIMSSERLNGSGNGKIPTLKEIMEGIEFPRNDTLRPYIYAKNSLGSLAIARGYLLDRKSKRDLPIGKKLKESENGDEPNYQIE